MDPDALRAASGGCKSTAAQEASTAAATGEAEARWGDGLLYLIREPDADDGLLQGAIGYFEVVSRPGYNPLRRLITIVSGL